MENRWVVLIDVECAVQERICEKRARAIRSLVQGYLDKCIEGVHIETRRDANNIIDKAHVHFANSIAVANTDGVIAHVPAVTSGYIAVTTRDALEKAFEEASMVEVARIGSFSLRV